MPGIKIGGTPVKRVVLGDGATGEPLKRVVLGDGGAGIVLWQNKPVVVITPGSSAQSQFRSALTSRGLDYATVRELPFDLDTSNVTDMRDMFHSCSSLTSVPPMDTSNVTNMNFMFYNCSSLRDGNVKLIRPTMTKPAFRSAMISGSGLTREPFFLPDGTPF